MLILEEIFAWTLMTLIIRSKNKKTTRSKDGNIKTYEKIYGYYGSFDQAVERFLRVSNNCVTGMERLDIKEYVKYIAESNKMAVKTFKEIMEGSVK